jgi:hypothetical protein
MGATVVNEDSAQSSQKAAVNSSVTFARPSSNFGTNVYQKENSENIVIGAVQTPS